MKLSEGGLCQSLRFDAYAAIFIRKNLQYPPTFDIIKKYPRVNAKLGALRDTRRFPVCEETPPVFGQASRCLKTPAVRCSARTGRALRIRCLYAVASRVALGGIL